jgi:acetate kinase
MPITFDSKRPDRSCILTINGGSSSLKFALFDRAVPPARLVAGRFERLGLPDARWVVTQSEGGGKEESQVEIPDLEAAVRLLIEWLGRSVGLAAIAVVGHRVVHGGSRFFMPARVTPELIEELRRMSPFDPDHLPGELALIEAFQRLDAGLPQVACFDTAFHHDMPRVAQIVPIPRRFEAIGVRRYGFHGLSYSFLMDELARVDGPEAAQGRIILAHLGSGASLAAVRGGRSMDTTMGFTPTSGIVMGTRSGDLDPSLAWLLERAEGTSAEQFQDLVNHKSGLLGVSETSPDVRDLLASRAADPRAAEAVDLFCYQVKKAIGAFAAALAGLDTLVFTGGIGENSPAVRTQICSGLEFLAITLDPARNEANDPLISANTGPTKVRVVRTDEELMIARQALPFACAKP